MGETEKGRKRKRNKEDSQIDIVSHPRDFRFYTQRIEKITILSLSLSSIIEFSGGPHKHARRHKVAKHTCVEPIRQCRCPGNVYRVYRVADKLSRAARYKRYGPLTGNSA